MCGTTALQGYSATIDFFVSRNMSVAPVTRALSSRAEVHLRQGNLNAALADAQRAVEISRVLQGDKPYSSLTGQALATLGRVHEGRGAHPEARAAAAAAVPHLAATLGEDHPDTQRARQAAQ